MRNGGIERLVSLASYCRLIMITAFREKEALSKTLTTVNLSVRAARDATPHQTNQTGNGWASSDEGKAWGEKEQQAAITVEMSTIVDKFSHEAITLLP